MVIVCRIDKSLNISIIRAKMRKIGLYIFHSLLKNTTAKDMYFAKIL